MLDALNDNATQELDWKHSIVDLMKLLSLDSSLAARKELAKELHYGGDTGDSATMNVWLHKQNPGESRREWRQIARLAEKFDLVYPALRLRPRIAATSQPAAVAVGRRRKSGRFDR